MACETKVFAARIRALKPKEVQRHITWAAAHLGVQDMEALTRAVLEAVFNDGDLPADSGEEMRRVLAAVAPWVTDPREQADLLLRLVALYVTYVRQGVQDLVLAKRRQDRQAPPAHDRSRHHEHTHCDDPDCRDHGHPHDPGPAPAQTPLARGIRAVIA
ncbi:hypothetical protein [Candidatus Thiodictyon syntrophicum]|uniref:Uncharacterized protein n=1 Tax=Candidatus Thiodictyon syntrophicum TaxID=1166950 RepID=A0A2K8UC05_9GAMM|nr:hypothetical protein [Candidatus Thiodictyon syntrophicum]AUB83118.1 hypothetical protein THSYN_20655 [Candidatus Thiodictyon syntrophicum]